MTTMTADPLMRLVPHLRAIFAACLVILGVVHVISGVAVSRMFSWWPQWLPGRPYWPQIAGGVLVVLGGLTLVRVGARTALALIGVLILLSVLLLGLSRPVEPDQVMDKGLNVFKWLAMAAGAFLFAGTHAPSRGEAAFDRLVGVFAASAKWLLAAFMIGAAVLHVQAAAVIAQYYIPAYIPWRLFWTYFTAGTLAAGGAGLLFPPTARLAAWLTSLMIFLWCVSLHLPRTVAEPRSPAEWCGIFESLAFAAMALLLAVRFGQGNAGVPVGDHFRK